MPPRAKLTVAESYAKAKKDKTDKKDIVDPKPTPGSAAANRAALGNVGSSIVSFFTKGGIPALGKDDDSKKPSSFKPIPTKEQADITAQAKAEDKKSQTRLQDLNEKYEKAKVIVAEKKDDTPAVIVTPKAAPYKELKDAGREEARRAFVQKQLKRLGIVPGKAGAVRSPKEKAARAKARAAWDKKNPFVPKSKPNTNSPTMEME